MPTTRSGRLCFLLIICACLFVIGRNLYRSRLNERLYAAVQRGDLAAVRDLVARHADVNYLHSREDKSLQPEGVADGYYYEDSVMRTAMAQIPGSTAQVFESKAQDAEAIVCLLIRNGVNLGAQGERGRDYLKTACRAGRIAIVRCLLDRGVDLKNLNGPNDNIIDNALGYGIYNQHRNSQEQKERGHLVRQMVQLFRERGVRITVAQAVQLDDDALLKSVLNTGESANQSDQYSQPALGLAVSHQNEEAVKMLLEHGAEVDAHTLSNNYIGETALCTAVSNGNRRLVKLLLAHGANVNFRASYTTPLLRASQRKHFDINGIDSEGESALTHALLYAPDGVETLLQAGANPNYVTRSQRTPLDIAASMGDVKNVRLLLTHGANVNAHPPRAHTAPYYARKKKKAAVVALLEKAGVTDDR